jgi:predicted RNA-binding Zn ribbon-like protein
VPKSTTDDQRPASGDLAIIEAFVNTADVGGANEVLVNPQALNDYLGRWKLLLRSILLSEADLERALAFREGLRALLFANSGRPLELRAVERLNRAAANPALQIHVGDDGVVGCEPASGGVDSAFERLLEIVIKAQYEGLWPDFKACLNSTCGHAYFDTSRGHVGRWCSRRCANQVNARTRRRRQSAQPTEKSEARLS